MDQIEAMLKVETNYDKSNINNINSSSSSSLNKANKNAKKTNSLKLTQNLTMKKSSTNLRIYYNNNNFDSSTTNSSSSSTNGQHTRLILNELNQLPRRDYTSQDLDLKLKNKFMPNSKQATSKQKTPPIKTPVNERTISSDYSNLKRIQRNQIYALNELMTKLEHEHFIEFCEAHNIEPRF